MIYMIERKGFVCVMLGIAVVLAGGRFARADDFEKFQERARQQKKELISKLKDQHAPCIVTLEFVAKESFRGQEHKYEMEAPGVMVSADGLGLIDFDRAGRAKTGSTGGMVITIGESVSLITK